MKKIKNYEDFKKIIENYGQSIPTKIIMGGKIHKKEVGTSKNKSQGYSVNASIKAFSKFSKECVKTE